MGGEHCRQAGLELICHTDELSGAGIVEALPAIPRHIRTLTRLKQLIPTVDALLVVDAPELGSRLIKSAHECGLRTAYLAPPLAWAWRPWRAKKYLTVIGWGACFPSKLNGIDAAEYPRCALAIRLSGHPLPPSKKAGIAILPGSRAAMCGVSCL